MEKERPEIGRGLATLIKIFPVILALLVPFVTLITMMSSYKDRIDNNVQQIEKILQDLSELNNTNNTHGQNIEIYRQTVIDDHQTLERLLHDEEDMDNKILDLWKQTAENKAKVDDVQTQISFIRERELRK